MRMFADMTFLSNVPRETLQPGRGKWHIQRCS